MLPDVSRFTETLRAQLVAIEEKLKVKIPTELDLRGALSDAAKIKAELEKAIGTVRIKVEVDTSAVVSKAKAAADAASKGATVKVDADTDEVAKKTAEAAAKASKARATIGVGADTSKAAREVDLFAKEVDGKGAKIKLSTSSDAFIASVKADVARAVAGVEPKIPLTPDGEVFRGKLDKVIKNVEENLNVHLKTGLDEGTATALRADIAHQIAQVEKDAGRLAPAAISVDVLPRLQNDIFAREVRSRIGEALKGVDANIPVNVKGETFRAELSALVGGVEQNLRARIPLEPEKAADWRQQTLASVAAVEALTRTVKPVVEIEVKPKTSKLSDDPFIRAVQTDLKRAVTGVEAKIPISADGETFRTKLAALIRATEATISLGVPLDVEKATEWRAKVVAQVTEIEALVRTINPKIDLKVGVDRDNVASAKKAITDLLDNLGAISKVRIAQIGAVFRQIQLISARTVAYVALLGPPIVLAASGALALAPSLATALPTLGALGAAVGVVALGFDSLFGAKSSINGKTVRKGGLFAPLIEDVQNLKGQIGELITAGLDPFVAKLQNTSFAAFKTGLLDVAGSVNVALQSLLSFGGTDFAKNGTAAVFTNITDALSELGRTAGPIARALLQISVAALPGFRTLNGFVRDTILRFTGFIDRTAASGQLTQVISKSVSDLIAFLSQLGRITAALIEFLGQLEPAARIAFSVLGSGAETALRALSDGLEGFRISGTIFAPLLAGVAQLLSVTRQIPGEILRALAPLVQSTEFASFVTNLGRLTLQLGLALAELTRQAIGVAGGLLQIVGIPVVGALGALLGGLADIVAQLRGFDGLITVVAAALTLKFLPAVQGAVVSGLTAFGEAVLPVVFKIETFVAALVRTAAVATAQFAVALARAAVGAVTAFVVAIVNVIASLAGFNGALLTTAARTEATGAAMGGLGASAAGLRGALAGAGAAVAAFEAVLTGGILIAITGIIGGLAAWQQAQDKAKASIGELGQNLNGFDQQGVQNYRDSLLKIAKDSAKVGESTSLMAAGFELFKKGVTFGFTDTPIADAAAQGEAAVKAIHDLNIASANLDKNLKLIGSSANLSLDQVIALAQAANVSAKDLSGDPAKAAGARQAVINQLDLIRAKTGLTAQALVAAAGPGVAAWEAFAKAIETAQNAANSAFNSQSDIIKAYKLPTAATGTGTGKSDKAIAAAATAVEKAQQRVDAAAARAQTRQQQRGAATATQLRALKTAQDKLTQAQQKSADVKVKVSAGSTASVTKSFEQTYKDLVKQATTFSKDIETVIAKGLDPQLVARLLQAGPADAAPVLQALVADHSGRLVKLANDSEAALRTINTRVLALTRLTTIAVASQSDQLIADLDTAQKIALEKDRLGAAATAAAIADALKIPQSKVEQVAIEFGIQMTAAVQDAVDRHPINVTASITADVIALRLSAQADVQAKKITQKQAQLEKQPGFRAGGLVRGAGTGTSDSIAAWLSNREFVQPARVVEHYGVEVMEALRARSIPRDVLASLARGQAPALAGLAPKLAAARPPAPPAARATPAPMAASTALSTDVRRSRNDQQGGPMQLTLVDANGVILGAFNAYMDAHERKRFQRERQARLAGRR